MFVCRSTVSCSSFDGSTFVVRRLHVRRSTVSCLSFDGFMFVVRHFHVRHSTSSRSVVLPPSPKSKCRESIALWKVCACVYTPSSQHQIKSLRGYNAPRAKRTRARTNTDFRYRRSPKSLRKYNAPPNETNAPGSTQTCAIAVFLRENTRHIISVFARRIWLELIWLGLLWPVSCVKMTQTHESLGSFKGCAKSGQNDTSNLHIFTRVLGSTQGLGSFLYRKQNTKKPKPIGSVQIIREHPIISVCLFFTQYRVRFRSEHIFFQWKRFFF